MIKEAIIKIVNKGDLTYDEAHQVIMEIMKGETTPTQNAAFLAALSTKSTKAETIDEISGCAEAMRSLATPVPHPGMDVLEIVVPVRHGRLPGSAGHQYPAGPAAGPEDARRNEFLLPLRSEIPRRHEVRRPYPQGTGIPDSLQHPRALDQSGQAGNVPPRRL